MRSIYRAEIPTQYTSDHRRKHRAIESLRRAERRLGILGQVVCITVEGVQYNHHSRQVVYPHSGEIRA